MRTIDKIISNEDCAFGAPMGRSNRLPVKKHTISNTGTHKTLLIDGQSTPIRIFDCAVPMSDGAYDKGGAYWGLGRQLRVSYTKDLQYVVFYRK